MVADAVAFAVAVAVAGAVAAAAVARYTQKQSMFCGDVISPYTIIGKSDVQLQTLWLQLLMLNVQW